MRKAGAQLFFIGRHQHHAEQGTHPAGGFIQQVQLLQQRYARRTKISAADAFPDLRLRFKERDVATRLGEQQGSE